MSLPARWSTVSLPSWWWVDTASSDHANARFGVVVAHVARAGIGEAARGLLEAAAVGPRASQAVHLGARRAAGRRAGDLQFGQARPEPRIAGLGKAAGPAAAVVHRRIVRPRLVDIQRRDAADEVEAPRLHRAARAARCR